MCRAPNPAAPRRAICQDHPPHLFRTSGEIRVRIPERAPRARYREDGRVAGRGLRQRAATGRSGRNRLRICGAKQGRRHRPCAGPPTRIGRGDGALPCATRAVGTDGSASTVRPGASTAANPSRTLSVDGRRGAASRDANRETAPPPDASRAHARSFVSGEAAGETRVRICARPGATRPTQLTLRADGRLSGGAGPVTNQV